MLRRRGWGVPGKGNSMCQNRSCKQHTFILIRFLITQSGHIVQPEKSPSPLPGNVRDCHLPGTTVDANTNQGIQTECGLGILELNINFWSMWWSQSIPIFLNYSSSHSPLFPLKQNTLKSRGNYEAVVESYLQSLASCLRSFSTSKSQFTHLQNGYRNITTSQCCCEQ